ncbi:MAG: arylsulfatase [Verrucomicrobiota bacterium]
MKYIWFSAVLMVGLSAAAATKSLPNIVLIYTDDLGYGDVGCHGATAVKTPNVDRLATTGLRFTSAYCTSATCTPSRYSLLTGEYAFRKPGTGVLPGDAGLIIAPGRTTLPSILKQAGYTTGVVGKWHLGLGETGKIDWNGEIRPGPLEVGFDHSFIMAATGDRVPSVYIENRRVVGLKSDDPIEVNYKDPFPRERTGKTNRESLKMDWTDGHNMAVINGIGRIGYMKGGKAALWRDEDMADEFTKHALAFIERSKDRPFFLYFATHGIHVPRVTHPRFTGKTGMGPRGDAILEIDWCVGEIVKKLDELKLTENTLIIFTSDNGPVLDDGYRDDANEKLGDHKPAGPLRGGKYSLFEGGTRIPFIVKWPARVKPGVSDAMISQVDFCATFAALTNVKPDITTMPDSVNLLLALLGESPTGRNHVVLHANRLALREGNWKYISPGNVQDRLGPWQRVNLPEPGGLYDLAKDLGETRNLAAEHPEQVKIMRAKLEALRVTPAGDGTQ